jgi:hypothetical protein
MAPATGGEKKPIFAAGNGGLLTAVVGTARAVRHGA